MTEKVEPTLKTFPDWMDFEEPTRYIEAVQVWANYFEVSQRKNLEKLRTSDRASFTVRRVLIAYIEKKVLGITRNKLGEEILKDEE